MTRTLSAAVAALAMLLPAPASAAEIKLLCTNALKTVMEDLAAPFATSSGHKLVIVYGSTGTLKGLIDKGEAFDVAILGSEALDDMVKQGKLSSRTDVAYSSMGVAVRTGAAKPDLSSTDAFKRTVMAAKSIAYTADGVSGVYVKGLFQRLGIAEPMQAKTIHGRGAEMVAGGKAELGITQISEILPVTGAELAGPLPADIQQRSAFPGAVSGTAKEPGAAKSLLKFLASPEAGKVMKAKGVDPAN